MNVTWGELAAVAGVMTVVWGGAVSYLSLRIMSQVGERFEKRDKALQQFAKELRSEFMGEKLLVERFDRIDERLTRHRTTYQDNWDQMGRRFDRLEEWLIASSHGPHNES